MTHNNKNRPQGLTSNMNDDREFKFWLRRLTPEQKLDALLWGQRTIMLAQELDFQMELQQMADTTKLTDDVTKLTDIAESLKTMYDGVTAERDALKVERDALLAADSLDQGAIDAVDEKLVAANAKLEALTAVATNTPAEPSLGGT